MSGSNTPNKVELSNNNDDNTDNNSSTAMMTFMLIVGPALCCACIYYSLKTVVLLGRYCFADVYSEHRKAKE